MSDAKITPHTLNFVKKLVSTFGVGLENVSNVSTMFSSAASESLARRAQATAQDPVFQKLKGQFTTGESDFVLPALEEAPLAVSPQSLTCEGIVVTAFRTTVLGKLVVLSDPAPREARTLPSRDDTCSLQRRGEVWSQNAGFPSGGRSRMVAGNLLLPDPSLHLVFVGRGNRAIR